MTASNEGGSLPKWQLALVVGAPVALGLGYMYYRNKNSGKTGADKSDRGKYRGGASSRENGVPTDKQNSSDCPPKVSSPAEPETPLQKAKKYKNDGNVLFKERKYKEAIALYNKAIDICPTRYLEDLATFYQNRAAAYEQLQMFSAVKEDCSKALELNPKYAKALLRRARSLEKIGDLVAALEDVTTTCMLEDFSNQTTLTTADRILEQLGRKHAKEHLANKKYIMPSNHIIKSYMKSFPNDPICSKLQNPKDIPEFLKEPLQAVKDQKYDDVIPLCTRVIESPEFSTLPASKAEVLLLRGTFYLLLGKHDTAMQDLESILSSEDTPKDVRISALIKRATLHMQLENPEMTFKDFELAIGVDPNCSDIYHHRGQVHLLVNKIEEAKNDFAKAVSYNPDFGVAYVQKCYTDYRFAVINREMGLAEMAMAEYEKAFEKFPDLPECYMLYAEIMTETQQYHKANMYFAKAIEKDPENATVYVHKGLLQLQWNSNIDKAVEYINKALELDDKCELGYESLGSIEVQRGNLNEAIRLFDKALEFCRTTMELIHVYSLRDATKTHYTLKNKLDMDTFFEAPPRVISNSMS